MGIWTPSISLLGMRKGTTNRYAICTEKAGSGGDKENKTIPDELQYCTPHCSPLMSLHNLRGWLCGFAGSPARMELELELKLKRGPTSASAEAQLVWLGGWSARLQR